MMTAANSFFKAEFDEQSAQIFKPYICVTRAAQDLKKKFIVAAHPCEPFSNYGRYDLANAALQLAVVSDRRAHGYIRSGDWRDAERD